MKVLHFFTFLVTYVWCSDLLLFLRVSLVHPAAMQAHLRTAQSWSGERGAAPVMRPNPPAKPPCNPSKKNGNINGGARERGESHT